ncbi:MAG: hypothetical protein WA728_15255 [Xanthobacteraceae bacterium]
MSLLGKVLPMTIADAEQNREIKYVVQTSYVWPEDKDGNIVYPSWWEDEEMGRRISRAAQERRRLPMQ